MSILYSSRIRLLAVDDDYASRLALKRFLDARNLPYQTVFAASCAEALHRLSETPFDVVLSDVYLGDGTAFDLLEAEPTTPFILVTAVGDEETIVRAVRAGVADYFVKGAGDGFLPLLPLSIERAVCKGQTDRQMRMLSAAVASANDAIYITDLDGRILFANQACCATYHRDQFELLGENEAVLWIGEPPLPPVPAAHGGWKGSVSLEGIHRRKSGDPFSVSLTRSFIRDERGHVISVVNIARDISEQKEVEAQIRAMLADQERSSVDFLAALNHLRVGVIITDAAGRVLFKNARIDSLRAGAFPISLPAPWTDLFPLTEEDQRRLESLVANVENTQDTTELRVEWPSGRRSTLEIELHVHPLDRERRILFVYDHSEVETLREQLDERAQFGGMIGRSAAMRHVFDLIREIGPLDATVLIEGETGTGKELVARAIHGASSRRGQPFVAVNCGTFTEALLASQLFGHKKGAFTGAIADHVGYFESAGGGTIFLDEICEMPLELQASLLRVLEQREIMRVGESRPRAIDVRVVAATNRDLAAEVQTGRFRSDLYYRVRVARIVLPPLRARREDIPLLANHALQLGSAKVGRAVEGFSDEAMGLLMAYAWPGNVRELNNVIEFSVMRCRQRVVAARHLPPEIFAASSIGEASGQNHLVEEIHTIEDALRRARGNRSKAARLLGISRATLYRRLSRIEEK